MTEKHIPKKKSNKMNQHSVQHINWYDAFIAHAEADLEFAKCLLKDVENQGFTCILAKRDFVPGNPVVENIATAIHRQNRELLHVSHICSAVTSYEKLPCKVNYIERISYPDDCSLPENASLKSEWCKYEMLAAINESHAQNSVKLLPVILEDVADDEIPTPLRFVTYIHVGKDPDCLDKLLKSLSSTDVSWESLLPAGNVAHGLAWSYYYGYLKVILPGIDERIRISKWWNQVFKKRRISQKLFLLFPESCLCRDTLTDNDQQITHAGHLETVIRNRAGTVNRPYKSTVYSINTEDDEELHFVGEYITAIHTMYEMEQEQTSGLNSDDKRLQATQFYITIQDILERDPECRKKYKILYYKDVTRPGQHVRIAKVLSKAIKEEISKELEIEKHSLRKYSIPEEQHESINIPSICLTSSISMFNMNIWNKSDFQKNEPQIIKDARGNAKSMEKDNKIINFFNCTDEEVQGKM